MVGRETEERGLSSVLGWSFVVRRTVGIAMDRGGWITREAMDAIAPAHEGCDRGSVLVAF